MRTLSSTLGAAVAGAVLATGAVFAGTAALTPSGAATDAGAGAARPAAAPAADLRVPCGAVFQHLPAALQEDLTALRDLSPAERRAAVRQLRRNALAGDYGARVESFVRHRMRGRHPVRRYLPAGLRADLRELRELPPAERADALEAIGDAAVGGEYGARVDRVATALRERRAACS